MGAVPADPAVIIIDHAAVGNRQPVARAGVTHHEIALVVPDRAAVGDQRRVVVGTGLIAEGGVAIDRQPAGIVDGQGIERTVGADVPWTVNGTGDAVDRISRIRLGAHRPAGAQCENYDHAQAPNLNPALQLN